MLIELDKINIVDVIYYRDRLDEASKIISDAKDVPYVALLLALDLDGVWTHDKHFKDVKTYKDHDLLAKIKA